MPLQHLKNGRVATALLFGRCQIGLRNVSELARVLPVLLTSELRPGNSENSQFHLSGDLEPRRILCVHYQDMRCVGLPTEERKGA
jgi:hypothetical protein